VISIAERGGDAGGGKCSTHRRWRGGFAPGCAAREAAGADAGEEGGREESEEGLEVHDEKWEFGRLIAGCSVEVVLD
jgi:hypothetical protein